jgi:alpha-D-ribose 1-methylphosphonate 5-triphosphate synthase subunit PhnG
VLSTSAIFFQTATPLRRPAVLKRGALIVIIRSCCPVELAALQTPNAFAATNPTLVSDLDICMTNQAIDTSNEPRRRWLAILARASRSELEQALRPFGDLPPLEHVRPPEPGMVMLRGRVGGTGDAFNLGEATVTRCALRVGASALGLGYALGRDRRKAELIAIFDAWLQDAERHAGLQREVVQPLAVQQAAQRGATSRAAATSKVEFFTFVRGQT